MLLKIAYLLICRVLSVVVLVFRGDSAQSAELLVLRHENAVLHRNIGRVRYEPADRLWLAALSRQISRRRCEDPRHVRRGQRIRLQPPGAPSPRCGFPAL